MYQNRGITKLETDALKASLNRGTAPSTTVASHVPKVRNILVSEMLLHHFIKDWAAMANIFKSFPSDEFSRGPWAHASSFCTRALSTLCMYSWVTWWRRSRFITASCKYLWHRSQGLLNNALICRSHGHKEQWSKLKNSNFWSDITIATNNDTKNSYLSLISVFVLRSLDSCWISDRRIGCWRGQGVTPNTTAGSTVSQTYITRLRSDAVRACDVGCGIYSTTKRNKHNASD